MGRKRRTKSVLIAVALAEDIRVGKYKETTIFPNFYTIYMLNKMQETKHGYHSKLPH